MDFFIITYPISVERLIKIWLIDGIQIIGNTIYYTVWTNDGYGNTFASFSDNLLHIILLPYNSSEPMAKYVAYIRGVKSQVNNRYFMYAKVYVQMYRFDNRNTWLPKSKPRKWHLYRGCCVLNCSISSDQISLKWLKEDILAAHLSVYNAKKPSFCCSLERFILLHEFT